MLNKDQISAQQFAAIVFQFTIGSSVLIIPSALAAEAKQDAWLASLFGVAIGLLLVFLYNALGSLYPQANLAAYSEEILGKWLGKTVSLLFFSFAILLAALVLRNIGDFIEIEMMDETPIDVIHIIMLVSVVMAVRLNLETLGRAAEVFFFPVIAIFILTAVLILPHVDMENLQPILGLGIKPVLRSAVTFIGSPFLELVVLLMLFSYVNRPKAAKKSFFIGVSLAGFWLTVATLLSVIGLSAVMTELTIYPTYYVAKKINVAQFIQRVESTLAVLWFISIFFKMTVSFYAAILALAQTLNLKNYRPLAVPLAMIIYILSIVAYPNIAYFREFASKIWPFYAATFGLVLPLILLAVGRIRSRTSNGTQNRKSYTRGRIRS